MMRPLHVEAVRSRGLDRGWTRRRHIRISLSTRMAVIRLSDGCLFVWSPIQLTDILRAEVDSLGSSAAHYCSQFTSPPVSSGVEERLSGSQGLRPARIAKEAQGHCLRCRSRRCAKPGLGRRDRSGPHAGQSYHDGAGILPWQQRRRSLYRSDPAASRELVPRLESAGGETEPYGGPRTVGAAQVSCRLRQPPRRA